MSAGNPEEFQCGLCHAPRGIAEAIHDPVGEGTVVCSYTHRPTQFFASEHEGAECFVEALEFLLILGVGIFPGLKFFTVGIVTRIDTDFFDMLRGFHGCLRHEMNIRHQRNIDFCLPYYFTDLP